MCNCYSDNDDELKNYLIENFIEFIKIMKRDETINKILNDDTVDNNN